MHFEWIGKRDVAKLDAWDAFLLRSPRGHYCQLSSWLKSYQVYGFELEVLIARRDPVGEIVGGAGLLYLSNQLFRLATLPIGPIVDLGEEAAAAPILACVLERMKTAGASLLQLHFPCSAAASLPALLPAESLPETAGGRAGVAFNNGHAHNEMLWIEFPPAAPAEDEEAWRRRMLQGFSEHHRRYIRQAERNGAEAREARGESELRDAYALIERHARARGYKVRAWATFGEMLLEQVARRQAVVLTVHHQGRLLGAHYGILAGRRYTYELGGMEPHGRDLKIGCFMQWAAMRKARELGLLGYDLTSTGTPGLVDFKMGFRPKHIEFVAPRYLVFSELKYKVFSWAYPKLRTYRGLASRILQTAHRGS